MHFQWLIDMQFNGKLVDTGSGTTSPGVQAWHLLSVLLRRYHHMEGSNGCIQENELQRKHTERRDH